MENYIFFFRRYVIFKKNVFKKLETITDTLVLKCKSQNINIRSMQLMFFFLNSNIKKTRGSFCLQLKISLIALPK